MCPIIAYTLCHCLPEVVIPHPLEIKQPVGNQSYCLKLHLFARVLVFRKNLSTRLSLSLLALASSHDTWNYSEKRQLVAIVTLIENIHKVSSTDTEKRIVSVPKLHPAAQKPILQHEKKAMLTYTLYEIPDVRLLHKLKAQNLPHSGYYICDVKSISCMLNNN